MCFLQVDPFASVSAAHHIGENVRHRIHESHPEVAEVFIQIGRYFYCVLLMNRHIVMINLNGNL